MDSQAMESQPLPLARVSYVPPLPEPQSRVLPRPVTCLEFLVVLGVVLLGLVLPLGVSMVYQAHPRRTEAVVADLDSEVPDSLPQLPLWPFLLVQ